MTIPQKLTVLIAGFGLVVSACSPWSTPDTPGSAAIRLGIAYQVDDVEGVVSRLCAEITDQGDINLTDTATFGAMAAYFEARIRNAAAARSAFGGDKEYSAAESVDIEADQAWTEIEFRGNDLTEVWRLSMVREDGKWKACNAELRQ